MRRLAQGVFAEPDEFIFAGPRDVGGSLSLIAIHPTRSQLWNKPAERARRVSVPDYYSLSPEARSGEGGGFHAGSAVRMVRIRSLVQ